MYICLCNALSDRDIRRCASTGCCRVADVYRDCGCKPQCGKCAPFIHEILREAKPASIASHEVV